MQRNAFGPSESEKTTSSFKVAEHAIQHAVGDYLHKVRNTEQDAQHIAEHVEETIRQDLKEVGEKIVQVVSPPSDEDEEGWASDGSAGSGRESPTVQRARSRSAKPKSLGKSQPIGASSRRHRSKRDGPGSVRANQDDVPSNRGSRDHTPLRRPDLIDSHSRTGSLRNLRLDNVRGLEGRPSREQSPARSVRFVDTDKVNSPRAFSFVGEGASSNQPSPTDEEDSPKNKVTFEGVEDPKP